MHRIYLSGIALSTLSYLSFAASADPMAARDQMSLDRFVDSHIRKDSAPPFAFTYGGKPFFDLLANWDHSHEKGTADGKTLETIVYRDPVTRLRLTVRYTLYPDFPAVEWVLRFKNEGSSETPVIAEVLSCAVHFDDWTGGETALYRALGSDAQRSDFAPVRDVLSEDTEINFGPTRGRSSDELALPFFNIAGPDRGIVAAIGWSGKWKASVKMSRPHTLNLESGMAKTHFRLMPGEEVRSPSTALLFWKSNDRMAGHNLFRRFVLVHHTPRPGGKPLELPLSHGVGFGGPFPCNEYVCATESYTLAMIDRLRQFGIDPDACWIDAGWYENDTNSWWSGVGSWFPSRTRFPRGLKPVTEAARKWGKGFVVWFEPERVYESTWLDHEHPEWSTRIAGNPNRLLNLGNPQALNWLTDHISNFLQSEGVTVYRQDFNFDPAPYWQAMDTSERVGIAEMKHIEGLYAYWDALLARIPGLLIDNCASGGRRIDLETIGRSVPLWRTDYSYFEPNGYQCHTYGLQLFLPCSGTGNNNTQKYYFRSSMGGAVVLGWEINGTYNNAPFNLVQAHEDIAEFRALRPYFVGDFYPLTEYSTSDEAWAAFQWNRPDQQDGIVLAFRRHQAIQPLIRVTLRELEQESDYQVSFEDYGITLSKKGRELGSGLNLKIPEAPGSLLLKYCRIH
ncbi:MAG TPA: alpha-galactosidase [Terriglobia bacterium]|nr:alpha-galactosidase [Terriglobia bacterium]